MQITITNHKNVSSTYKDVSFWKLLRVVWLAVSYNKILSNNGYNVEKEHQNLDDGEIILTSFCAKSKQLFFKIHVID